MKENTTDRRIMKAHTTVIAINNHEQNIVGLSCMNMQFIEAIDVNSTKRQLHVE